MSAYVHDFERFVAVSKMGREDAEKEIERLFDEIQIVTASRAEVEKLRSQIERACSRATCGYNSIFGALLKAAAMSFVCYHKWEFNPDDLRKELNSIADAVLMEQERWYVVQRKRRG